MASIPLSADHQNYCYSDCIFSTNPLHHLPTPIAYSDSSSGSGSGGGSFSVTSPAMYGGEVNHLPLSSFSDNLIINVNNGAWIDNCRSTGSTPTTASNMVLPFEYSSTGYIVSSTTSSSFLGIPASALPEYCEGKEILINYGEECSSGGYEYSSNFWQPPPAVYPLMTAVNREIAGGNGGMAQRVEDNSTLKIACRYSAEEKKDKIMSYLKKRSQRNFTKSIKYACRKTLADRRIRIRGRFAKNEVGSDDDQTSSFNQKSSNYDHHIINCLRDQEQLCCVNNDLSFLQMIPPGEEEWLQESIASFVYYGSALPDGQ